MGILGLTKLSSLTFGTGPAAAARGVLRTEGPGDGLMSKRTLVDCCVVKVLESAPGGVKVGQLVGGDGGEGEWGLGEVLGRRFWEVR